MTDLRNSWKLGLAIAAVLIASQIAVSLSARTHRVHNYLSARLENAFGRPVQVQHFNLEILPSPRIYATGVRVGEDPAFGYEYFLRAEHLTAGLRWSGFFHGRIELGTLYLGQPSLTLVRNAEGRWNLEDWLPPAGKNNSGIAEPAYGPARAPLIANRLERIEFDDGRINFKTNDTKRPFALTAVSGTVEQLSAGRWKLQIDAQPWRSGVTLQSAGIVQVHGDIAGTSARLQPASLSVHWEKASLADLFRLLHGQDYGVRGTFSLDADAKSGAPTGALGATHVTEAYAPSDWSFSVKVTATQLHRWDLTERSDNPDITARATGRWNIPLGRITAETLAVESPASNLHGTAQFALAATPAVKLNFDTAAIQGAELLSWYRAFHSGVAEGLAADQFFTGAFAAEGWPLKLDHLNVSSSGGTLAIKGLDDIVQLGPLHASLDRGRLAVEPLHVSLLSLPAAVPASALKIVKATHRLSSDESDGEANLTVIHDSSTHAGTLFIQGRVEKTENILKIASAFGYTINHGWDLTGPARADLRREWSQLPRGIWNGVVEVSEAQLAAAGLNQPVQLHSARLEWRNGKRFVQVAQAEGFGAAWSGNIVEEGITQPEEQPFWNAHLHADHLNAAQLDRWIGPRARPGWLQRLLPSLINAADRSTPASELLRRLNVSGDFQVDELTIEKLKLQQVHLLAALHDLQLRITDGRAQWAGGKVRANMLANFLPQPLYEVHADVEGVNLSQLPIDSSAADRVNGSASVKLHLKTTGVGRDELLQKLTAGGEVHFSNLEFRGWDLNATVADGEAHPGISRWPTGEGTFAVRDRKVILNDLRLDGPMQTTFVNGSVTFGRDANLGVENTAGKVGARNSEEPARILKIVGPLEEPRLSREKIAPREPAD
jgi:uncharacterized protein involved in outer membrane biogenesis